MILTPRNQENCRGPGNKKSPSPRDTEMVILLCRSIKFSRQVPGAGSLPSEAKLGYPCILPGKWKAESHCPSFPVCSDGSKTQQEPTSAARCRNRKSCPGYLRLPAGSSEIPAEGVSAATSESLIRSRRSLLSDSILGHETAYGQIC